MPSTSTKKQNKDLAPKDFSRRNKVIGGLIFLGKSVKSQWKVLFSITVIFLIITSVLASATFILEHLDSGGNFKGPWFDNPFIDSASHQLTFGECFWWVFVTISTVGYGDIYPVTAEMRAWGIFISIVGISFLALYTAVIVNGFTQEFQKRANPEQFEEVMKNEEQELMIEHLTIVNKKFEKELEDLKEKFSEQLAKEAEIEAELKEKEAEVKAAEKEIKTILKETKNNE